MHTSSVLKPRTVTDLEKLLVHNLEVQPIVKLDSIGPKRSSINGSADQTYQPRLVLKTLHTSLKYGSVLHNPNS